MDNANSSQKPRYELVLVGKDDKQKHSFMSGWVKRNERGEFTSFSITKRGFTSKKTGEVRKGVKSILVTFEDGTTVNVEGCFVNMYDNEARRSESRSGDLFG